MLTYLEITDENIQALIELGIPAIEGDELECEVTYDINRADPEVGIMSDDFQVTSVTHDGTDVERFFDVDKLTEEASDDREALREDMADRGRDR